LHSSQNRRVSFPLRSTRQKRSPERSKELLGRLLEDDWAATFPKFHPLFGKKKLNFFERIFTAY
jgi:hypothetical protein